MCFHKHSFFKRTIDNLNDYYDGLRKEGEVQERDTDNTIGFYRELLKDNGIEQFIRVMKDPDAAIDDEASLIRFLQVLKDFERKEIRVKKGNYLFPVEIEDFREVARSFQDNKEAEDKRTFLIILRGMMVTTFVNDIGTPLSKMVSFHNHNEKSILTISKDEHITIPFTIPHEALYNALKKYTNQDHVVEQLAELTCPDGVFPKLIGAYSSCDKHEFINILIENKIDISRFNGYVLLSGSDDSTPVLSKGGYIQQVKGIKRLVQKTILENELSDEEASQAQEAVSIFDYIEELVEVFAPFKRFRKRSSAVLKKIDRYAYYLSLYEKIVYFFFKNNYLVYLQIKDPEEKQLFDEVLSRPTGRHLLSKFLTRFNKENSGVQKKIFEKQLSLEQHVGETTTSKQMPSLFTLKYDSSFISEEEFVSMPVMTDDKGMYYEGSKTFTLDDNEAHNSYVNTTLLYEYLAKEAIEHCPQNYYAFLYRMTARRRPEDAPDSFRPIPFLLKDKDGKPNKIVLAYFIGRVLYKVKDYKKDTSVPTESGIKKPHYGNYVWDYSFKVFFDAGEYSSKVKRRVSEAAGFEPKPRDSHKASINGIAGAIFGKIE